MDCTHHHNLTLEKTKENKTLIVIIVTLITMIGEIIFGHLTNSMALLADGFHMGTHALALSITYLAYVLIRKLKNSDLFAFNTGKINTLAGYTSSIFLAITSISILYESIILLFNPIKIAFSMAILVAVIGLFVNLICLFIMEYKSDTHANVDYNYKSAYIHILTDALTSFLAIIALFLGKYFHLYFLDPIMGIVGGIIILKWSINLIKDTTIILLDMNNTQITEQIKHIFQEYKIKVHKISSWKISENSYGLLCEIYNNSNLDILEIKNKINSQFHFEILSIEVINKRL